MAQNTCTSQQLFTIMYYEAAWKAYDAHEACIWMAHWVAYELIDTIKELCLLYLRLMFGILIPLGKMSVPNFLELDILP